MARPPKDGKRYFPLDVDFMQDDKIKLIFAEFKSDGVFLWVLITCKIYAENGYYKVWDDDSCLLLSAGGGGVGSPNFVREVIKGCVRRGLFDKTVFDMFGVLTSHAIQKRYIRMCADDEEITFIKEFFLLDTGNKKDVPSSMLCKLVIKSVKSTENPIKSTENPIKSTENPQNKTKQNKTKEYVNRAREGEGLTALDYGEFISVVETESPIIFRRHQAIIDGGNLNVVESVRQLLDALYMTEEEYRELFGHAEKTYISQPKFTRCDVVWVLNNHKKVTATEIYDAGSGVKKQKKESGGESWGEAVKRQLERYENE